MKKLLAWFQKFDPTTLVLARTLGELAKTALQLAFWGVCYVVAIVLAVAVFRVRVQGRRCVPATGGVLIACNHQSFLDPMLTGLTAGRRIRYMARSTLFRWAPLRWVIEALGAIKVEREGVAKEGLRRVVDTLQAGNCVAIWPEGTRSRDGKLGPLKPGILLAIRRANAPVVVCGIAGAFECWPRMALLPWPGVVCLRYESMPASPESATTEERLDAMSSAISRAQERAERHRQNVLGRVPPLQSRSPGARK